MRPSSKEQKPSGNTQWHKGAHWSSVKQLALVQDEVGKACQADEREDAVFFGGHNGDGFELLNLLTGPQNGFRDSELTALEGLLSTVSGGFLGGGELLKALFDGY